MNKIDVVTEILKFTPNQKPTTEEVFVFAPSNIALCKYWGKRDTQINLPITSSLSISLKDKGAHLRLSLAPKHDVVILNQKQLPPHTHFVKRLSAFLDLFRQDKYFFKADITSNIPIAAGLASSACGFASIVLALNALFGWRLAKQQLSILARLGSGSACRSVYEGFVEWQAGERLDGMDSYAQPIDERWEELCIGILMLHAGEKPLTSGQAMQRTVLTSPLYQGWPKQVGKDLDAIKKAISLKNFTLLGETAEANALTMHALMLSARPSICYFLPETIMMMQKIWALRKEGLEVYFTQDAGPNLKILFEKSNTLNVRQQFEGLEVV